MNENIPGTSGMFYSVISFDLLAAITNSLTALGARGLKSKCPFTNGHL